MERDQSPQIETPTTHAEYNNLATRIQEQMNGWMLSSGWSTFHVTNNVTLESKPLEGCAIEAQKSTVILAGSDFAGLTDKLFNPTFEERKRVYDEVIYEKVIEHINADNIVVCNRFAAPLGVSTREFVVLKSRKTLSDGSMLITAHSINYPNLPVGKGCVRGIVRTGMRVIKLGKSKIQVVKVEHVDPCGWIPTWIVQSAQMKNAQRLDAMQRYLS